MHPKKTALACAILMTLAMGAAQAASNENAFPKPYGKYEIDHGYTIIRGERYGIRPTAIDNVEFKWSYTTPAKIGAIDVADMNMDGIPEVLVGLDSGHVVVLDNLGRYLAQYYVGNSSVIGKVYSIATLDANKDGRKDMILGLGGAKRVFTFSKTGFKPADEGNALTPETKVLYQIIRNYGGVYVMNFNGGLLWNFTTTDSINAVKIAKSPPYNEDAIYAGLGDRTNYIYNEYVDYEVRKRECQDIDIENESTYYDEEHCTCDGCDWYDDPEDPEGGECFHTYNYEKCGWVTQRIKGWNLTEYPVFNGTVFALKTDGSLMWMSEFTLTNDKGEKIKGADNNIVDVEIATVGSGPHAYGNVIAASDNSNIYAMNQSNWSHIRKLWNYNVSGEVKSTAAYDLDKDGIAEVIAGSSDGTILMLDGAGNLKWKQRVDDIVTDIKVLDLEDDGYPDIIASSRDKNIYVLDNRGTIRWKYNTGRDIYGVNVADMEGNSFEDIIVFSPNNVTCFELTEFYVKSSRGRTYYDTASQNIQLKDYTKAMIFAQKAKNLFEEIEDKDNLGRTNILIEKINDEFALYKKLEAERYYKEALGYYSVNSFDDATVYANKARELYKDVNDEEGQAIMDTFLEQIKRDKLAKRKMEADGYYTKALSFKALGNYSAAVEYADHAKAIYEEVKFYNGSVSCDQLVARIGDDFYRKAENYFRSLDYAKAMENVILARGYYVKADDEASAGNAASLMVKINESMSKPPPSGFKFDFDYRILLVGAVIVLIVVLVLKRKKKTEEIESEPVQPGKVKDVQAGDLEPLDDMDKPEG